MFSVIYLVYEKCIARFCGGGGGGGDDVSEDEDTESADADVKEKLKE